jgi:hypothetical protein
MDSNLMQDGVISLDDRPAIEAVGRANTALDGHEKKVKEVMDRTGKVYQMAGEQLVRVTDNSRNSLDRLLSSMQRQSDMAGKSGVERMVMQRDQLISKWGQEKTAVDAITASYAKQIKAAEEAAKSGGGFNARYAFFGLKDIAEGRTKFAVAELGNELMCLSGSALGIGLVVTAVVGIGLAAYEVTKRLDELREANEKLHGELDRLADSSRMENAELALSNTTLENLIAKLEHRPENSIKQALEEAAVAAGHLTEKLDGSIGKFYELLKKNEVSGIMQLFAPDDKDLAEIVGGKTGLGGMRGEIYEILRQGGDPTAVLKQYQVEAGAALKQAEYNQAHPLTTKERARLGMDVAGVGGAITGALMPNEDYTGRIEKLQALVQQIGYISQSYGLEKQHAELTGRKDQLEAAERDKPKVDEDLKRFREQAQAFERRGDEAELSAIGKIYYARDQLLEQAKKLKGVEADVAAIRKAADEQAGAIYKKDWEKFEAYDQEQRDKRNRQMALMMGPSKEQLKEWEQRFAAQDQVDSINLQSRKEGLNREAGQAQKMVGLSGLTGGDAIRATYQIRIDLAKQLAAVEAERISKETNAADQLKDIARASAVLKKDISEAQQEALIKQLELQKQQVDTLKKETEGLWHTLLTKPQNFPKQLGSTVHEAILKPVTEGLAGMSANVLKPIIYGPDGNGGLSGMFKGVFGGGKHDPMKVATDLNTAVTAQNSMALATLTAILAGAMGMAAPAIAAPAGIGGISLPSISAPAVSGSTASTIAFGGGASSGSSFMDLTRGLNPMATVLGGGGGVSVGGGVSTSADIPTLNHAASGGPGFLGKILGGGQQGAANPLSGIQGMLKGFKGVNWGGITRTPARYTMDADGNVTAGTVGPDGTTNYGGKITGANGALGAAMGAGGMMLAQQGLLGSIRGTWGGVAMGTAGGAAIGFQQGGPLGAAIGGAAGLLIGVGEKLAGVETPENEAKRLVKQLYAVNIDNAMARQIVSLAQQKYAGHVSIAVRDPDVRKMLELYAQGTGQKMPLSATTPRGGSLAEQGGNLYQQATYQYGVANTFQSPLPVMGLGGGPGGSYPNPGGPNTSGGMGTTIALNINGQPISPEFVADSSMAAQNSSYGRVQQSANLQVPGLMVGT